MSPAVIFEFGGRSSGEHCELRSVHCDGAAHLSGVEFPEATPQVMRAERTFWEKATAIYVFCAQASFGAMTGAYHWHDVARVDAAGFTDSVIADKAPHWHWHRRWPTTRASFSRRRGRMASLVDDHAAVAGGLRLVPEDGALAELAADSQHMVDDGEFLKEVESFDALLRQCRAIQEKANSA